MSYADSVFIDNCREIIRSPITDEQFPNIRAKWPDGTPAHTRRILYVQNRYELAKDSIPVVTLRKLAFKNCVDEMLWMYQKQTTEISKLRNPKLWEAWDVGDGTAGRTYGYQFGKKFMNGGYSFTRVDWVLNMLREHPNSRGIILHAWSYEDLDKMGCQPCTWSMQFNVTHNTEGKMVLNGILNQRSQDTLTANCWDVVAHSVLLQMFAQVLGMEPGTLVHSIADMHIYDRHIPIVKEMIVKYDQAINQYDVDAMKSEEYSRLSGGAFEQYVNDTIDRSYDVVPHPNPKFWINPKIRNFYDFTVDDVALIDYEYEPFGHKIEVAV